jgi:hypothetical protein
MVQTAAANTARRPRKGIILRAYGARVAPHALEAKHNALRGLPNTEEARQRMSEAHRRPVGILLDNGALKG